MRDRLVTIVLSVAATYGLMKSGPEPVKELDVDRLIVRKELIVSDTGVPWEKGYEAHQIPRGVYARSLGDGPGGLWVRSRLIKGEIDDPFDDRFHALERDGSLRRAPGHISWNVWLDGAWRQMAIIQGEGLELSEVPRERWSGLTHPGRLRFQTFRPGHGEPLTDALIGQGMMSVGGGGYGGGGLPYPVRGAAALGRRDAAGDDPDPGGADRGQGRRLGRRTSTRSSRSAPRAVARQPPRPAGPGDSRHFGGTASRAADAYLVVRDGKELGGPIRIEGSRKEWTDRSVP